MRPLPELLAVATEATAIACEMIRSRDPGVFTSKGDRDMATEVDFAVERAVRELLAQMTPEIGLLGEEEGTTGGTDNGLLWSLDPIDGTVNFTHGLPLCAVSLGLVTGSRSIVGVVELPFLGGKYTAVHGGGAYLGGRRLHGSHCERMAEALVALGDFAVGLRAPERNQERLRMAEILAASVQRVRMFGTAATDLAWVAEGKLDACVLFSNKPWDTSAGVLIAREAGVEVLDVDGSPHTFHSYGTVAVAKPIAGQLIDLVSRARRPSDEQPR
jgi:myo-inositol-1(or 4)-monophosphatase